MVAKQRGPVSVQHLPPPKQTCQSRALARGQRLQRVPPSCFHPVQPTWLMQGNAAPRTAELGQTSGSGGARRMTSPLQRRTPQPGSGSVSAALCRLEGFGKQLSLAVPFACCRFARGQARPAREDGEGEAGPESDLVLLGSIFLGPPPGPRSDCNCCRRRRF